MTAKNLSLVTTNLIESYGNTARNLIHAYRVGGERVVGFMDQRWESALEKSATRLSDESRTNALAAERKFSAYYMQGIRLTTAGADSLLSKAVELAGKGVRKIAANATRFDRNTGFAALERIAQATAPVAESVGNLACKIERQSDHLVSRIAGAGPVRAKRATAPRRARSHKTS